MPLLGSPPVRLPTVEMWHKKLKIKRIVNATVYAMEYLTNPNWTTLNPNVSGYREGNATKAEVVEDKREYELNKHRLNDPVEAKKRGDRARAREGESISINSKSLGEAVKNAEASSQEAPPKVEAPVKTKTKANKKEKVNWRKMPWFKLKAHVKEITGTSPKSKVHAEELMDGRG